MFYPIGDNITKYIKSSLLYNFKVMIKEWIKISGKKSFFSFFPQRFYVS